MERVNKRLRDQYQMTRVNCAKILKICLPTRQNGVENRDKVNCQSRNLQCGAVSFFINLCTEYRLSEVYASVDMDVLYPCRKNYLNMKALSFLRPTGSGIVTFRDYIIIALSFVSRFKTIFSLREDFHCLVTRAYARIFYARKQNRSNCMKQHVRVNVKVERASFNKFKVYVRSFIPCL